MRRCGYIPEGIDQKSGEIAFWRSITGGRFPRFHIYAKEQHPDTYLVNLHLDQKAPSYSGTAAHSGEYEGPLVEQEAQRVSSLSLTS